MCVNGNCDDEQYFIADDNNQNVGECVISCVGREKNKANDADRRCYKECPSGYTVLSNGVPKCIESCSETQTRIFSNGTFGKEETNYVCLPKCSEDKPIMSQTGECVKHCPFNLG